MSFGPYINFQNWFILSYLELSKMGHFFDRGLAKVNCDLEVNNLILDCV